ncbi:MAG: hypothetical protein QG646_1976 [Euryarchaeota archaeon]|nr:hypothetical protein [Euryarchaeota archaeon]
MLKDYKIIKERHIQNIIAYNSKILGLGKNFGEDLVLVGKEMRQDDGRRLDLLFQDKNSNKVYEVEIQLGRLDESHLSRAIGYWDVERKKYPRYEHTAVVIAEDIGDRMLDLIKLFKEEVPIIVIIMTESKKENEKENEIGLEFEIKDLNKSNDTENDNDSAVKDEYEPFEESDIYFGEKEVSKTAKKIVDKIYDFLKDIDSSMKIYYTKNYIGFKKEYNDQFVLIEPRRAQVEKSTSKQSKETNTKFKVSKESDSFVFIEVQKNEVLLKLVLNQSSETETKIKKWGFSPEGYQKKRGQYPIKISENNLKEKKKDLIGLLEMTCKHNIKN